MESIEDYRKSIENFSNASKVINRVETAKPNEELIEEEKTSLKEEKKLCLVQSLSHKEDIHRLQIKFVYMLFYFTVIWAALIFFAVISSENTRFSLLNLSDTVIVTLLSTTMAKGIVLFFTAAKWLYSESNEKASGEDKE